MRAYIASLTDYNNGKIIGIWIDIDSAADAESVQEKIDAFLKERTSETGELHEEWAMHDSIGMPQGCGGHPAWSDVSVIFETADRAAADVDAVVAYIDSGCDISGFDDAYRGRWESEEDYAYDLIDSCYDLEKTMGNLARYFDYAAFTRDIFVSDCFSVDCPGGGVWVFNNI